MPWFKNMYFSRCLDLRILSYFWKGIRKQPQTVLHFNWIANGFFKINHFEIEQGYWFESLLSVNNYEKKKTRYDNHEVKKLLHKQIKENGEWKLWFNGLEWRIQINNKGKMTMLLQNAVYIILVSRGSKKRDRG